MSHRGSVGRGREGGGERGREREEEIERKRENPNTKPYQRQDCIRCWPVRGKSERRRKQQSVYFSDV